MSPQDRGRAAKIAGVAGITLLVAACGSSSPSNAAKSKVSAAAHSTRSPAMGSRSASASPGATSGTVILKPERAAHETVLATSKGFTVYGFTRDSSTASACTGACARTWHPLTGTPRAAAGMSLSGTLGTITRSGGVRQATFDGHPLYTFKEDKTPGETKGNGELEFGGRWLAIPVSAAVPVTPSKSGTSSATSPGAPSKSATPFPSRTRIGGSGP